MRVQKYISNSTKRTSLLNVLCNRFCKKNYMECDTKWFMKNCFILLSLACAAARNR